MIYVLFAEGFEEIEALTVVDVLRRAEIAVQTVSINKDNFVTGSHRIKIETDINIEDIAMERLCAIDALVFPGGIPGTPNLKADNRVKKLADFCFENKKLLCAICAAPGIFGDWGYFKGEKATANPYFMDKIPGSVALEDRVVADGTFITSRAAGTAFEFAMEIISCVKGRDDALKLKDEMLYK